MRMLGWGRNGRGNICGGVIGRSVLDGSVYGWGGVRDVGRGRGDGSVLGDGSIVDLRGGRHIISRSGVKRD
jgi:hypothetical protein